MKKRLIFIIAFAAVMCSCDTEPSLRILGVWYVHDTTKNIELTFVDANHQLIYYEGPIGIEAWPGRHFYAGYEVQKDSLMLFFSHPFDTTYSTGFYISGNKLTIDAFPYQGLYEKMTFKRKN